MINRKLSKTLCRLSSILVCMALVLLTVPAVSLRVSAANSGKTKDGSWSIKDDVLTFSGTGSIAPSRPSFPSGVFTVEQVEWYRNNVTNKPWGTKFTKVVIDDGITEICPRAFPECTQLTHITLPKSITTIGSEAFIGCKSIPSLDLPANLTTIGQSAFDGCSSLTSLTLPDGIKTIESNTFKNCSALTELHIPNNVMTIGESAFDGCAKLTTLQIPASVKRIDKSAFSYCSALESLTVDANNLTFHSDGNCIIHTTNTVLIAGCANSQIPSDGSVTAIGDTAFLGQSGLSTITIPQTITSIGKEAFRKTGLSSVTLPKSVTKIDEKAFADCEFLSSVTISDTVTSIAKDAFEGCSNITIRGKFGSYAETFATENDFIFVEAKDSEFIIPGENANNWVWYLLLPIGSIVLVVVGVFVGFFLGKRKRPTVITETLPATEPRTDESAISQQ